MSDCCRPAADDSREDGVVSCPESASTGTPVELETVKALLTESALARLEISAYRFCCDAACPVVYFGATGQRFMTTDIRVPVWQKQPFGRRMVCYCFGENEADIRVEIARDGRSRAVERVTEHIRADRCACEVRNPRGKCCLGELAVAVKRVMSNDASPLDEVDTID